MSSLLHFLAALALTLLLTPLARRVALRTGVVDLPGGGHKTHADPTPLLGGLAIYAAFAASMAYEPGLWAGHIPVIMLGATTLLIVGILDDCVDLIWTWKLAAQIGVAILFYRSGIRVQLAWLPRWMNLTLTLAWLVGITNAVNFLDNMNGLAAGLTAIAAGFFALLGLMHGSYPEAALSATLAGAALGFLYFNNSRRASIFMGDAGSLPLGLLLAVLGLELRFPLYDNWVTWKVPIIVMLVPVFDMTLVCLSRLRRGRNPLSSPGQDHISHRLLQLGLTRTQAVRVIHGIALTCGAIGLWVSRSADPGPAYTLGLLTLALFAAALVHFEWQVPAN